MNLKIFLQKTSNLFVENRLLKFLAIVQAIAWIYCFNMAYDATKYVHTILLPQKVTSAIEYVNGKPNEKYIKQIARDIVGLGLTYSPPVARAQFDELLGLYSPEVYPQALKTWYSLADRIENAKVTSIFFLSKIEPLADINEDTHAFVMSGDEKKYAETTLTENGPKSYRVEYKIDHGKFQVISLQEKNQYAISVQKARNEEKN